MKNLILEILKYLMAKEYNIKKLMEGRSEKVNKKFSLQK
jgi:hypothetical protein